MGTSGAVCRRIGRPFPPTAEFAPSSPCIAGSACTPVEAKSIRGLRQLLLLRSHTTERWCRQTHRLALQDGYIGRGLPSHRPSFPADGRIRPELPMAGSCTYSTLQQQTDRQASAIRSANKKKSGTLRCDGENAAAGRRRTGRPSALFWDPGSIAPRRRHIGVPSPPTAEFAPSSRRAKRGGPTLRSVIYGGSLVGFPGSRHRSHQKPLHVLIGSPSTIYEGGAVARTGSGGATRRQSADILQ